MELGACPEPEDALACAGFPFCMYGTCKDNQQQKVTDFLFLKMSTGPRALTETYGMVASGFVFPRNHKRVQGRPAL